MIWRFYKRPGFFGKRKREIFQSLDRKFGKGNWRIAWRWGKSIIEWLKAVEKYEDGYYHFFIKNPDIVEYLVTRARDVYDVDPSDIDSKLDYRIQNGRSTHLQDIAVRRCIQRLGRVFEGDQLIRIRSNSVDTIGQKLSPGRVPFHQPEMIESPPLRGWWNQGTVEDFYQSNKIIEIKITPLSDF